MVTVIINAVSVLPENPKNFSVDSVRVTKILVSKWCPLLLLLIIMVFNR